MKQQLQGFSLLEMMIVILIIGIGAATIRVAIGQPDPLEPLEKNAYEFSGWLNSYTDQALFSNQEKGVMFTKTEVALLDWREGDELEGEEEIVWEKVDTFKFPTGSNVVVELILDIESEQWVNLETRLPEDDVLNQDPLEPQVIIFPSEEYQPSFHLVFRNYDNADEQINMVADGFNRLKVTRDEQ